jgi:V/A-type H+-transporting ATPase subunit I
VEGIFNLFETFLGMISNTASFIRVGAFALNHVGLFIAFHTLANMIGSTAGNITMFILGNVIVLALEGLVVFIQGLRLFYYELFSKYYTGDGILFTPDKI